VWELLTGAALSISLRLSLPRKGGIGGMETVMANRVVLGGFDS